MCGTAHYFYFVHTQENHVKVAPQSGQTVFKSLFVIVVGVHGPLGYTQCAQ